jgi:hypothetical protein
MRTSVRGSYLCILAAIGVACALDAPIEQDMLGVGNQDVTLGRTATLNVRSDSILFLRAIARGLAVSLRSAEARASLYDVLRVSSVREGKIHLQRALRGVAASLGRQVSLANGLGDTWWIEAVDRLPDLEMYFPYPDHRDSWHGTGDLLVAGFLETDNEIRANGNTVVGFDTAGRAIRISYSSVTPKPVLVIYPAETIFGSDGISPPTAAPTPARVPSVIPCDPESTDPNCSGPPDYCSQGSPSGATLYFCRVNIYNIDQYEEWLRGSSEITFLMRSITVDAQNRPVSWVDLACDNEDATGSRWYDQDFDSWSAGHILVTNRATLESELQAGKRVIIMFWEDDNGSKCDFQPEDSPHPNGLDWEQMHQAGGWLLLAGVIDGPSWLILAGGVIYGLTSMFATSGDDLIGSVVLPPGSDPTTSPKEIRISEDAPSRGWMTFLVK